MCRVLKKSTDDVEMLDVKYTMLDMLRPLVKSSQDLEKDTFKERTNDKEATWILKAAKDADLDLDDDLKLEVKNKLSGKKRKAAERGDLDFDEFVSKGEAAPKQRNKEEQRKRELKKSYEKDKQKEMTRRFANSSYLTPESIRYLNDVVKKNETTVDQELVYAGLHSEKKDKSKFKRTENKKQRYKGRQKRSKHRPTNKRA